MAEPWLGDVGPLLSQMGSPAGLASLARRAPSLRFQQVNSVASLREFLWEYRRQVLVPLEWPVVVAAFGHAARQETRELLALDVRLAEEPLLAAFASASRQAGRSQLRRLHPLRDHRVVQRYWGAVQAGRAHGWHTVVYGVVLAVYSVPLRQGLVHYAAQTTRGFIQAAAGGLRLTESAAMELHGEVLEGLGVEVEGRLGAGPGGEGGLRVVP